MTGRQWGGRSGGSPTSGRRPAAEGAGGARRARTRRRAACRSGGARRLAMADPPGRSDGRRLGPARRPVTAANSAYRIAALSEAWMQPELPELSGPILLVDDITDSG